MTETEQWLWQQLRAGRFHGHKFRRQVPIGNYIADFICPQTKLIVELDGSQHAEQQGYDDRRSVFLESQGYRVLRFWNADVVQSRDGVLAKILAALDAPLPARFARCPSPLEGEG